MTIQAKSKLSGYWYTPESEINEEEPTRFKIQGLGNASLADFRCELKYDGDGKIQMLTGRALSIAIRNGLLDWENFTDSTGENVSFSLNSALELLPYEIAEELAFKIFVSSRVTEAEKKT